MPLDTYLRPFAEVWLPYAAAGTPAELADSDGRLRYADDGLRVEAQGEPSCGRGCRCVT